MAVIDAYATAVEYRGRVTKSDTGDDATILAQLTAISRLIDQRCRRFFTQDTILAARVFDGNGKARVWIDDIATATGLIVKADLNGDYDYADSNETLTLNTDFWLGPDNTNFGAEVRPWTFIELIPTSAKATTFPLQRKAVEITATWGWPAIPGAIKEATISITRELRDIQEAGATLSLENIDAALQMAPVSHTILMDIVRRYGLAPGV